MSKQFIKLGILIWLIILPCISIFCQKMNKVNFKYSEKTKGKKTYEGSFEYCLVLEKDGEKKWLHGHNPKLDFKDVENGKVILLFRNIDWEKKKHKDFQLRIVPPNKVKGLTYINTIPKRFLQNERDQVEVIYKVAENGYSTILLDYTIFTKDGKVGQGNISQNYNIVGIEIEGTDTQEGQKPTANFAVSASTIQVGNVVHYYDESTNNPEKWTWTFEGGLPNTSNKQSPVVTYENTGKYSVGLTVYNKFGEASKNLGEYISVTATGAIIVNDQTEIIDTVVEEEIVVSAEDSLWKFTSSKDSLNLYLEFLDLFPDGNYATQARQKALELQPIDATITQEKKEFIVELFYAKSPLIYEVIEGDKEQIEVDIKEEENKIFIKVKDLKAHKILLKDARGKTKEIFVDGGIPQLVAKFEYNKEAINVNVTGGLPPYFADFQKEGDAFVFSYALGDSLNTDILLEKLAAEGLKGVYSIFVKDSRKGITASEVGTYRTTKTARANIPLWAFLSFPLLLLVGWLVYKNR